LDEEASFFVIGGLSGLSDSVESVEKFAHDHDDDLLVLFGDLLQDSFERVVGVCDCGRNGSRSVVGGLSRIIGS
jgi:hypothetical protein